MNQVEVFVYLHSIAHGITTVSAKNTLGFRQSLPTHLVEFIPDPEVPRRGLIRMPHYLAAAHGLLPSVASKVVITDAAPTIAKRYGLDTPTGDENIKDKLQEALNDERRRVSSIGQSNTQSTSRFRPARDSIGNEAGLLTQHRARSQVEQLADELPVESFPHIGE